MKKINKIFVNILSVLLVLTISFGEVLPVSASNGSMSTEVLEKFSSTIIVNEGDPVYKVDGSGSMKAGEFVAWEGLAYTPIWLYADLFDNDIKKFEEFIQRFSTNQTYINNLINGTDPAFSDSAFNASEYTIENKFSLFKTVSECSGERYFINVNNTNVLTEAFLDSSGNLNVKYEPLEQYDSRSVWSDKDGSRWTNAMSGILNAEHTSGGSLGIEDLSAIFEHCRDEGTMSYQAYEDWKTYLNGTTDKGVGTFFHAILFRVIALPTLSIDSNNDGVGDLRLIINLESDQTKSGVYSTPYTGKSSVSFSSALANAKENDENSSLYVYKAFMAHLSPKLKMMYDSEIEDGRTVWNLNENKLNKINNMYARLCGRRLKLQSNDSTEFKDIPERVRSLTVESNTSDYDYISFVDWTGTDGAVRGVGYMYANRIEYLDEYSPYVSKEYNSRTGSGYWGAGIETETIRPNPLVLPVKYYIEAGVRNQGVLAPGNGSTSFKYHIVYDDTVSTDVSKVKTHLNSNLDDTFVVKIKTKMWSDVATLTWDSFGYADANTGGGPLQSKCKDIPGRSYFTSQDSGVGTKATTKTFTFNLSGKELMNYLNESWYLNITGKAFYSDTLSSNEYKVFDDATISITHEGCGQCAFKAKEWQPTIADARADGWGNHSGSNQSGATLENYCSHDLSVDDIPWDMHSTEITHGYGELVANQAGAYFDAAGNVYRHAQDWTPLAGMPSTENLSLVLGGQCFTVDASGLVTKKSGVDRTITFNVTLNNYWGNDSQNVPCSLSCPGHSNSNSNSISVSATGAGSHDEATCDWCGTTISVDGETSPEETDPVTGEVTKEAEDITNSDSHSCSVTVTFNCSTNAAGSSGDTSGYTLSSSERFGQGYDATVTGKNLKGADVVTLNVTYGLLCEGYTTGKGHVHSNNTNCVHRTSHTETYVIHETIDSYAYRKITYSKIMALIGGKITSTDTNVLAEDYTGQSTTNANLETYVWIGGEGWDNNTFSQNGRLWFTEFAEPTANGGWTVTCNGYQTNYHNTDGSKVVNTGGTMSPLYYLTDCVVNINLNADSVMAKQTNHAALDTYSGYSTNQGQAQGRWKPVESTSTDYQDNPGDWLTTTEAKQQCNQAVNHWLASNNGASSATAGQTVNTGTKYTVNVLSDAIVVGAIEGSSTGDKAYYQTVIGDVYAVDNGILLFNTPFDATNGTQSVTKAHLLKAPVKDIMNALADDQYSVANAGDLQSTLLFGYQGIQSNDVVSKYAVPENVTSFDNTIIGMMSSVAGLPSGMTDVNGCIFSAGSHTSFGGYNPYWGHHEGYTKAWNNGNGSIVDNSGACLSYKITTSGTSKAETFDGYYRDFTYPNIGSFTVKRMDNGVETKQLGGTYTNNGAQNMNGSIGVTIGDESYSLSYLTPLVVSNLDLKNNLPNGVYSNIIKARIEYEPLLEFGGTDCFFGCGVSRPTQFDCQFTPNSSANTLNSVVIHNPISVENAQLIGNEYGSYKLGVTDESKEDMRLDTENREEEEKASYIVINNPFHIWVSDLGNFSSGSPKYDYTSPTVERSYSGGTIGSDKKTGEIFDTAWGYSKDMNTGRWTSRRTVEFSFPVSYYDAAGNLQIVEAGTEIELSNVRAGSASNADIMGYVSADTSLDNSLTKENVQSGYSLFHYGSQPLQNFKFTNSLDDGEEFAEDLKESFMKINEVTSEQWDNYDYNSETYNQLRDEMSDSEYVWGLDYEFTCLLSSAETSSGTAIVRAYSFNTTNTEQNKPYLDTYNYSRYDGGGQMTAASVVEKTIEVDIVGRIGNLAIEDVSDFRFSNFFKSSSSEWLIDGVIKKVDSAKPVMVIATAKDILGDDAATKYHGTLSVTNLNAEFANAGKAGPYSQFPLTSAVNNVEEYKNEQMKLGYMAYMDIETIGNYDGINDIGRGPLSANDKADIRSNYVSITPYYVLYDYENNEFIPVDLYCGSRGSYSLFWSQVNEITSIPEAASLYTDIQSEAARRNISEAETLTTKLVTNMMDDAVDSVLVESDFIGTAGSIKLDQYNRTYIGSEILRGRVYEESGLLKYSGGTNLSKTTSSPNGSLDITNNGSLSNSSDDKNQLSDFAFAKANQRYHFTIGLPSSTIVTYPDAKVEQGAIEKSADKIKSEHPNSVLLCFADIYAQGDTWTLHYDAKELSGNNIITLWEDGFEPDVFNSTWNKRVDYSAPTTNNGADGKATWVTMNGAEIELNSKMPCLMVMDAWSTSSDDLDTFGTH